jgi:hypothetical protein
MPRAVTIDTSKSLAELSGIDWGPPPAAASILVQERHEIRLRPIARLTHAELIRFLDMGFAGDSQILIPVALERLHHDPVADGGAGEGELLCVVMRHRGFPWRTHPEFVRAVRALKDAALNEIAQTTDDYERVRAERDVYKCYAGFEYELSAG